MELEAFLEEVFCLSQDEPVFRKTSNFTLFKILGNSSEVRKFNYM